MVAVTPNAHRVLNTCHTQWKALEDALDLILRSSRSRLDDARAVLAATDSRRAAGVAQLERAPWG